MKWLFATGTSGIVLSLYLWETKSCMAGRAFAICMGLTIPQFVLLQAEKSFDFACKCQEFLILGGALCDVL